MRLAFPRPVRLFLGPIFQKEVRVAGRRRRTYALRCAYVVLMMGIVALAFAGMIDGMGSTLPVQRLQRLQEIAPMVAMVVVWVQFVMLALSAPILTSGAINEERTKGTLGTLLSTPLSAGQIVCGKLASRLVQLLVLSLLATPLLLSIRVFGGVEARFVVAGTAIGASTAVLGAALGLAYSNRQRRAALAALFAVLSLALIEAGPMVAYGIAEAWYRDHSSASSQRVGPHVEWLSVASATCSPAALGLMSVAQSGAPVPTNLLLPLDDLGLAAAPVDCGPVWAWNCGYTLTCAGGLLALTTRSLRRKMAREGAGQPSTAPTPSEAVAETASGSSPARARSREVSDAPVLWREVRQASFGSRTTRFVVLLVTLAMFGLLYGRVRIEESGMHAMVLVIAALGVVLQATFTTTMGFGSEREGRTWDVLLTTPMSPSRIVWGKLAGALRSLWFFPTVAMAHMVLAVAAGGAHPVLLVHAGLILLGPAALLSGVGTSLSLRLRRGASAAVLNLALALGLWALSWVVLAIVSDALRLMGERDLRDRLEAVLFCINPVAMAVSACEGGGARRGGMRYEIPGIGSHVGMGTFTLVVLGVAVGYVGLAWGAARLAIARFVRWAPRAS